MFDQLGRTITTAASIFVVASYTYGVAKISARAGLHARGNPVKEKILSTALGIDPPKNSLSDFVESLPVPGGQCEVEPVGFESPESKDNAFWQAFQNLLGEREEEKE